VQLRDEGLGKAIDVSFGSEDTGSYLIRHPEVRFLLREGNGGGVSPLLLACLVVWPLLPKGLQQAS